MIEEEKKAIEYLKGYKYQNEVSEAIDIVLNLIQKQQEEIEKKVEQELIEKLENKIKIVNKAYEELLTDIGGEKILYLTGLSKKEKDEKINKSNCLQVQKYCYEEILEMLKGKEERKKQNE